MNNTTHYHDQGTFRVLKVLITVVACLVPFSAVVILYFVKDMGIRLGVMAVFTAAFAACITITTTAALKDIFFATTG
jgi:hypothetical protein